MPVKSRSRTDLKTEQAIEAFAAMAEKPLTGAPSLPELEPLPSPATPEPSPARTVSESDVSPGISEAESPDASEPEVARPAKAAQKSPARRAASKVKSALAPAMAEWKVRNREPKVGGINFRASASQLDLLRTAALVEEISQQKVLERLVWPILEEKYGSGSSD